MQQQQQQQTCWIWTLSATFLFFLAVTAHKQGYTRNRYRYKLHEYTEERYQGHYVHVIGIDNTHTDTEISSLIGQLGVLDSDLIRASPWQPHRPDDWRIFLNIFQENRTHTQKTRKCQVEKNTQLVMAARCVAKLQSTLATPSPSRLVPRTT